MKIVAIFGSPRKGNTETLAKEFLKEVDKADIEIEEYYLKNLKYSGCIACAACKTDKSDGCIIKDELTPVLESIIKADVVLLATPVYFSDLSGLMKNMVDRWYSFIGFTDGGYHFRISSGKKMVFILTQTKEDLDLHSDIIDRYNTTFMEFGFEKMITLHLGEMRDKDVAVKNEEYLHSARALAKKILL